MAEFIHGATKMPHSIIGSYSIKFQTKKKALIKDPPESRAPEIHQQKAWKTAVSWDVKPCSLVKAIRITPMTVTVIHSNCCKNLIYRTARWLDCGKLWMEIHFHRDGSVHFHLKSSQTQWKVLYVKEENGKSYTSNTVYHLILDYTICH
jgi:hypothetical protein